MLWPKGDQGDLGGSPVTGWLFAMNLDFQLQGCLFGAGAAITGWFTVWFFFVLYWWTYPNTAKSAVGGCDRDVMRNGSSSSGQFRGWGQCVCVYVGVYIYARVCVCVCVSPLFICLVSLKEIPRGKLCASSYCIYFAKSSLGLSSGSLCLSGGCAEGLLPGTWCDCRSCGELEGEAGEVFHQQHLSPCPRGPILCFA